MRALLLLWIGCSAKTDPLPLIPEPTPPRLIAPLSGSWIGSQPLLRWESEGEVTVQLCRDRSCSDVLFEKKLEAEEWMIEAPLDRFVHWRVLSSIGASATWHFRTLGVSYGAPFGCTWDLDGDGRSELVVSSLRGQKLIEIHRFEDQGKDVILGGEGFFGFSSACGDFDGDGRLDLALGDPTELGFTTSVDPGAPAGRVIVIFRERATVLSSDSTMFGYAMSYAGDLNGDGYGDLLIGQPRSGIGPAQARSDQGRVFVYYGAKEDPLSQYTELTDPMPFFGSSVGGGSDLDGDGLADFAASHPGDPLRLYLMRGGASFGAFETLRSDVGQELISAGAASFELAGSLWVGLPGALSGRVFWYFDQPTPASIQTAERPGFGSAVAAGDWNGDGSLEVAVGSNGQVHAFAAPASPIDPPHDIAAASHFGRGLRSLDANGDGSFDLLVTAPGSPQVPAASYYLYLGSGGGLGMAPALEIHPE